MFKLKIIRKFYHICYNPSKLIYTLEFTFTIWVNMLNFMGLMTFANQIKVRIGLHLLPERKIVQ